MNLNSQQEFQILKDGLGLSDTVIDEAKFVSRNASEKGLVRGRTNTTIVAAAVYIACRESGSMSGALKNFLDHF